MMLSLQVEAAIGYHGLMHTTSRQCTHQQSLAGGAGELHHCVRVLAYRELFADVVGRERHCHCLADCPPSAVGWTGEEVWGLAMGRAHLETGGVGSEYTRTKVNMRADNTLQGKLH